MSGGATPRGPDRRAHALPGGPGGWAIYRRAPDLAKGRTWWCFTFLIVTTTTIANFIIIYEYRNHGRLGSHGSIREHRRSRSTSR